MATAVEYATKEIFSSEEIFIGKLQEFVPKLRRGLTNLTELNNGLFAKLSLVIEALRPGEF